MPTLVQRWSRRWFGHPPAALLAEAPRAGTADLGPGIGRTLAGRYALEQVIGNGSAGLVFRGRDLELDLPVAIKVFRGSGPFSAAAAREANVDLRAEARASLRLTHPNIARVHTYARDEGWEFLVMELVPGMDLLQLRGAQPEGRIPMERALRVGVAIADALAYAHRAKVVHNDVKPSNILLDAAGIPKLCDFGLSLVRSPSGSDRVAGSPLYMAPERLRGQPGTPASDQYSFAATLYSAAAGVAPFGNQREQAIRGHVGSPLPAHPAVTGAVEAILRRAMAKGADDRFASMDELRDALHVEAERAPLRRPTRPPSARAPTGTTAGTASISARQVHAGGRPLLVAPFRIEIVPVTNAAYHAFVHATGAAAPSYWYGGRFPAGRALHPVVGVTFDEARAYAQWVGRRLPTEAEWVAVARGPDSARSRPWGEICDGTQCQCPRYGAADTCPVDAHSASATPEGVLDLLGNVWEWVECDPRLPAPEPGFAIALGGSFRHACPSAGAQARTEIGAGKAYQYVGFRCAMEGP